LNIYHRNFTGIINYFLDNICPPFLRDCKYFIYPLMRLAYGREAKLLLEFKEKFPFMSDSEYAECYRRILNIPLHVKRKTDLNDACVEYILRRAGDITGKILDVGCGGCYVLNRIALANPNLECHGADSVPRTVPCAEGRTPIVVHKADIVDMPFPDHSFDMVICTHTLEHLRDPRKALNELIRIAKRRLIIVVPRQREYRYTIDFHVNFYPYMYSFKRFIGIENAVYLNIKGDFLCCIDFD